MKKSPTVRVGRTTADAEAPSRGGASCRCDGDAHPISTKARTGVRIEIAHLIEDVYRSNEAREHPLMRAETRETLACSEHDAVAVLRRFRPARTTPFASLSVAPHAVCDTIARMTLRQVFFENSPDLVNAGLLILRVFIGPCFVVHALGKLGVVGPGNMKGFEEWLASLNFPAPRLQARMAMLSEMVGGILITLGLLFRPACVVLIGTMLIAAFFGHKGGGYLVTNDPPGNEYPLNLAAICLMFLLLGPGQFALDALIFG